jgi:hypothetical protein
LSSAFQHLWTEQILSTICCWPTRSSHAVELIRNAACGQINLASLTPVANCGVAALGGRRAVAP